jgi:predicted nicotinamide N-methyase
LIKGPNLGIDWKAAALGHSKNKRKTVGFGEYDRKREIWSGGVVHLREVSVMTGGFGAAVWDAAIIMARWIYMNPHVFEGKEVHELGCGVGLPGLVAARFCHHITFSDYLPGVLENMQYNIDINTNMDFDEESDEEEIQVSRKRKELIKQSTCISTPQSSLKLASTSAEASTSSIQSSLPSHFSSSSSVVDLNWDLVSETNSGSSSLIPLADIIIGSELTYSPKSVDGLIRTLNKHLKSDGVFYEILSTDRDGVSLFLDLIRQDGWDVSIHPVPEIILSGKFNTKQRPESYRLYTFRRSATSSFYPDFA